MNSRSRRARVWALFAAALPLAATAKPSLAPVPAWRAARPYDPERPQELERALDPLLDFRGPLRRLPMDAVVAVARRFELTPNEVLRAVGTRRDPPQAPPRGPAFGDLVPLNDAAGGTRRFRVVRDGAEVRQISPRLALGRDEVTVRGYRAFLDATGRPPPPNWSTQLGRLAYPVVSLLWEDAAAYAAWTGGRLPTSEEWSLAAGLTKQAYPWGNARPTRRQLEPNPPALVARLLEPGRIAPPGRSSIDLTRTGLRDMVWNVEEWCLDARGRWYRAVRGGSVAETPAELPDLRRVRWRRKDRRSLVRGFRVAYEAWPLPPR